MIIKYDKFSSKVSTSLLYPYVVQAENLGFDQTFVLAELGITEGCYKQAMTQIPFSYFLESVHKLIKITECPSLGLSSSSHFHPSIFGPLAYLMLNSATIGQAYKNYLFYEPMINEAVHTESYTKEQTIFKQISYPEYSDVEIAPVVEAHLLSLVGCAKFLSFRACGEKPLVKEVSFKHPPQADPEQYKNYFGVDVKFNQEANRFAFDVEILDYIIPGSDSWMANCAIIELNSLQSLRRSERKFKNNVYDFIRTFNFEAIPTTVEAAEAFTMSLSTFKRRLKEESSTFKGLVEQVRMDKAEIDLADLRLNLSDISSRLGYSGDSAFFRAFKRWTGETPAKYRKKFYN